MIELNLMVEPQQITIPFEVEAQMTRDNLFPSASNSAVVQLIDDWPNWAGPMAIIDGPKGSGKSHAARAWSEIAKAERWSMEDFCAWTPENLQRNIMIDDAAALLSSDVDNETKLFHLINALRQNNGFLLLTSSKSLPQWNVNLLDLQSRLQTAVQVSLKSPDDMLLSAVITKLFSDRQMQISLQNVHYLVTHMDRSLANAQKIVENIDQEALRRKSKITRNIVAYVLNKAV